MFVGFIYLGASPSVLSYLNSILKLLVNQILLNLFAICLRGVQLRRLHKPDVFRFIDLL